MDKQRGDKNKFIHYLLQKIQFLDVPQTAVEINNFIRTNMKLTKWS